MNFDVAQTVSDLRMIGSGTILIAVAVFAAFAFGLARLRFAHPVLQIATGVVLVPVLAYVWGLFVTPDPGAKDGLAVWKPSSASRT